MDTIKDIDGNILRAGDRVNTIYGECVVQPQPTTPNKMVANHLGTPLRVKDKAGHVLDILTRLAQVKLIVHIDPSTKTTTEKYGV
jgi:hypothetical protein